ncbi:non-homologous end joining protein Ku [Tunturiibacter lichenicola]|jgi:DNA end-binding protein Ku|uniref:non-homologous end joining protein Ku n=1 Tax=Tunturiibacter lichenicola TaxID=2051959 RepID=UPI0021B3A333|nr:Ku protein [Edaphobacter lichenicola]
MARPYWSGRIQISLVSFGVQLYVATEAKSQISFNQISRSTGERVRHQKVLQSAIESSSDGATAAPAVQKDEIVKGYEYKKGEYVIVENSELENLRVPSKHTVDVTQFVSLSELNPEYVEKPYFLVPEADSTEAFAVVRRALQKTGKAAIGTIAFSGREHVFAISAAGDGDRGGMMGYTLRYSSELRNQSDYFRDIKQVEINEESLELAESLIAKRSAKLDLSKFQDGYELAVKELVAAKVNHLPVPKDDELQPARGNVVNLMDALRKSIGGPETTTVGRSSKKPVASATSEPKKGIGLVKPSSKATAKRKSA